MSDEMISTIEVRGKVYPLATMRSDDQHVRHYDRHGNSCVTGHEPMTLIVSVTADGARELYFSTTNPTPCRISFFGKVVYVARAVAMGHGTNPQQTDLYIDAITAVRDIPATPTLDEPTAPADVDWSEIRSATEARDWRRAWQAVGTDHTGDATPGETYLLSKAARAKAAAAALVAWRKVEMPLRMARIDERHENGGLAPDLMRNGLHNLARTEGWQRIKRIAGWVSQARAQYNRRGVPYAAWDVSSRGDRPIVQNFQLMINGEVQNVTVPQGWGEMHDRLADQLQAAMPAGLSPGYRVIDDFRQEYQGIPPAEPVVLTRGNGGITGTVTIPPSTSRSIATMLATQARLTGGARLHVGTDDESITITPSSDDMIRWQRPDPAAATSHVGIATHATNPNPRGPQPRRRSRT